MRAGEMFYDVGLDELYHHEYALAEAALDALDAAEVADTVDVEQLERAEQLLMRRGRSRAASVRGHQRHRGRHRRRAVDRLPSGMT
jgi:hypothetical protein